MSALTTNAPITEAIGGPRLRDMAAVKIYDGSILGMNTSGYVRGFTLGDRFAGHSLEAIDNSAGSAGGKQIRVRDGIYQLQVRLSGVAASDVVKQSPVYAQDSGTLSLYSGLQVGKVVQIVSSGVAIVEFNTRNDVQRLAETITKAGCTDSTSTTGYQDFSTSLPAGALVQGWQANTRTAATGDTTATIQVGVSGNVDRFSQVTSGSVFATGIVGSGAPTVSGDPNYIETAVAPRVTITGGSDFTALADFVIDVAITYTLADAE